MQVPRRGRGDRQAAIDSFLNESARPAFGLRWIVSTCGWNGAAERAIAGRAPRVARIDFLDWPDCEIRELRLSERIVPDDGRALRRADHRTWCKMPHAMKS